ncbi:MAG: hypothetical protein RR514_05655 [Christensenella sp.]
MIYEFCTYDVKENKRDEFEVLAKELTEYYRSTAGVKKAECVRQLPIAGGESLTYLLYLVMDESGEQGIVKRAYEKYERRFIRCVDGVVRDVVGVPID